MCISLPAVWSLTGWLMLNRRATLTRLIELLWFDLFENTHTHTPIRTHAALTTTNQIRYSQINVKHVYQSGMFQTATDLRTPLSMRSIPKNSIYRKCFEVCLSNLCLWKLFCLIKWIFEVYLLKQIQRTPTFYSYTHAHASAHIIHFDYTLIS